LLLALALAAVTEGRAEAQSPPAAPETIALGDWQLAPTLQLRTRGEYRHDPVEMGGRDLAGNDNPRIRNAYLVFERTRIGLGAERGALRAQATLQDAHAWGDTPFGQLGVYQAWVEARTASAHPSWIRVGRQPITWGDGRLLGNADWNPIARSLDAVRAHVGAGPFDFEALSSLLELSQPSSPAFGDRFGPEVTGTQLYGAMASWAVDPLLKLELVELLRVARAGVGASRFGSASASGETFTTALRVAGEGRGWKYAVEGAYQHGTASALAPGGLDRSAYAIAGRVGRTFDTIVLSPTLTALGSYASGDDGGSTYKQFDPILPDVHLHHGAMDLFSWSNLMDAGGRLGLVPWTDTQLGFEYRYARLANGRGEWLNAYLAPVARPNANAETALGHELDVVFAWQPWVPLDLRVGWSTLLLGDGARTAAAAQARGFDKGNGTYAPARFSHLAYLQATLAVP
jgi:hypothetical protein